METCGADGMDDADWGDNELVAGPSAAKGSKGFSMKDFAAGAGFALGAACARAFGMTAWASSFSGAASAGEVRAANAGNLLSSVVAGLVSATVCDKGGAGTDGTGDWSATGAAKMETLPCGANGMDDANWGDNELVAGPSAAGKSKGFSMKDCAAGTGFALGATCARTSGMTTWASSFSGALSAGKVWAANAGNLLSSVVADFVSATVCDKGAAGTDGTAYWSATGVAGMDTETCGANGMDDANWRNNGLAAAPSAARGYEGFSLTGCVASPSSALDAPRVRALRMMVWAGFRSGAASAGEGRAAKAGGCPASVAAGLVSPVACDRGTAGSDGTWDLVRGWFGHDGNARRQRHKRCHHAHQRAGYGAVGSREEQRLFVDRLRRQPGVRLGRRVGEDAEDDGPGGLLLRRGACRRRLGRQRGRFWAGRFFGGLRFRGSLRPRGRGRRWSREKQ